MELLKVSSKSSPKAVAGALAGVIREEGKAELQAIGAGAVNQAIKAIAIARGYTATSGIDLVCIPAFVDVEIDGDERTAIKFLVTPSWKLALGIISKYLFDKLKVYCYRLINKEYMSCKKRIKN